MNNIKERVRNNTTHSISAYILVFYVIAIVILPLTPVGMKGTGINTIIKASILLLFSIYFVSAKKFDNRIKLSSVLIIFLYFSSQLIVFIIEKNVNSLVNAISMTIMMVICLIEIPRLKINRETILRTLNIFIIFVAISCIYNVVYFADRILSLSFMRNIYYDMYSFFDNKNTYGIFLFSGLAANVYSLILQSKKMHKVTLIIISFSILLSLSRTALFSSLIFITVAYSLTIAKKPQKIIGVLFITFIVTALLTIDGLSDYAINILIRSDVGSYREPIYRASIQLFLDEPLWGYGENAYGDYLKYLSGNLYTHNGYLAVLLSGGFMYFIAYIMILIKQLRIAIKIRRSDFKLGSYVLSFIIASMIYSLSESIVFIGTSATNYSITLFTLIIPQIILINLGEDSVKIDKSLR